MTDCIIVPDAKYFPLEKCKLVFRKRNDDCVNMYIENEEKVEQFIFFFNRNSDFAMKCQSQYGISFHVLFPSIPTTIKLSENEKKTLRVLRGYPNDIVMSDGWLTGGHGIKLNTRTVAALKKKGLIGDLWSGINSNNRISELGKTIQL